MSDVQLLTRGEAAQRARISVLTLSKLIRSDRGPTVTRIGRNASRDPSGINGFDGCQTMLPPSVTSL